MEHDHAGESDLVATTGLVERMLNVVAADLTLPKTRAFDRIGLLSELAPDQVQFFLPRFDSIKTRLERRRAQLSSRPASVDALIHVIKEQLQFDLDFSLEYEDPDFDGSRTELVQIEELPQQAVMHIVSKDSSSSAASTEILPAVCRGKGDTGLDCSGFPHIFSNDFPGLFQNI